MSALRGSRLAVIGSVTIALAACADNAPLDPSSELAAGTQLAAQAAPATAQYNRALAELRRVTARYHDVAAALADDYVPVGECEVHEGEHPGGIPYANLDYLLDGVIDTARPDALLYEPDGHGGVTLVGVELAIPYPLWSGTEPPELFGEPFRREDDMGVFGLHIWVWRNNPDGMFAWGNPRVSCGDEE